MSESASKKSSGSRSSCILIAVALIVLVFLGIPMLLTMMLTDPKRPWTIGNRALLKKVRDGIESYYRDHGRLPAADTFDGLAQLLLEGEGPSAPYLSQSEHYPIGPTLDRRKELFYYLHDRKGRGYVITLREEAEIADPYCQNSNGLKTSSFRFSPDGLRLAVLFNAGQQQDRVPPVGACCGLIVVVDAESGEPVSRILCGNGSFWSYRFLEGSKRLVTTDCTKPVIVWDAESGRQLERPLEAWGYRGLTLTGSFISAHMTVEWNDGIDVAEREKLMKELAAKKLLPLPFHVLFYGPDSHVVTKDFARLITAVYRPSGHSAYAYREHSVWNAQTGERLHYFPRSGGTSVAVSADGKQFAIGRPDGHIDLYDVESGEKQASFSLGEVYVSSVAFSPDGTLLAAGCSSLTLDRNRRSKPKRGTGEVRVLDVATGEQRASFGTGIRDLPHVRFSPDGKVLVADDGFVSLGFWNTGTWEKEKSVIPWPSARGSD